MRLAYTTLACPAWSVAQIFDAAQRYDYEGVEMRLLNGEVITPKLSPELRQDVLSASRKANIPIMCLDTSVSIAQPDPEAREAQVQDGFGMLELAATWGASYIRVFANIPAGSDPNEAHKGAVDCLTRLAEHGAKLGVAVLLETHDVVATGQKVMAVLDSVPALSAGALWDTLHPYRMGEAPEATLKLIAARLRHVHIKDGRPPQDGGSNWDLKLLGEGQVPIAAMLRLLKQNGYDGWLAVEWEKKWHPEIAEPEVALPQHSQHLRDYLTAL